MKYLRRVDEVWASFAGGKRISLARTLHGHPPLVLHNGEACHDRSEEMVLSVTTERYRLSLRDDNLPGSKILVHEGISFK